MMKENIKLSLYIINEALHHEDEQGNEGRILSFLTSAPDGVELSALRLDPFNPGEDVPGTYLIRDWVIRKPVCTFLNKEK